MKKRIFLLVSALLLLYGVRFPVHAHEVPDLTRRGSIEITMRNGDSIIPGGAMTLYRVGEIQENNGDYSFRPAGDFADWGEFFDGIQAPELAAELAQYAAEQACTGVTKEIGSDGKVLFSDLELGLYLLVQTEAAGASVNPFLVSVPKTENGVYVYQVEASPKTGFGPPPETTVPPTKPQDPTLPQTGQLNWPVSVLTVLGLGLFIAGYALHTRKHESE